MQTARADVFGGFVNLPGGFGNTFNTGIGELDIDAFSCHQRFILHGDGGVWLGQNAFEIAGGQRLKLNANRQAALQFRDQIRRLRHLERARGDKQNMIRFDHPVFGRNRAAFYQRQ